MSILSLAMYGSRARGDYKADSDTDLFAITDDSRYEMIVNGKTNIACYPMDLALARSAGGDLFFMHVVTEGVCLYDNAAAFKSVVEAFCYKASYKEELVNASELCYGLLSNKFSVSDFLGFNKRIVWCLRTILISRSAEDRSPKFSAKDLSELFGDPSIERVIKIKDSELYEKSAYFLAEDILKRYGVPKPAGMPGNYTELASYFEKKGNQMGVRTVRMLSHDIEMDEYGWAV